MEKAVEADTPVTQPLLHPPLPPNPAPGNQPNQVVRWLKRSWVEFIPTNTGLAGLADKKLLRLARSHELEKMHSRSKSRGAQIVESLGGVSARPHAPYS
jgi:hypothetical protein